MLEAILGSGSSCSLTRRPTELRGDLLFLRTLIDEAASEGLLVRRRAARGFDTMSGRRGLNLPCMGDAARRQGFDERELLC